LISGILDVNPMQQPPPRHALNYRRRFIGLVICLSPALLLLVSLALGLSRQRNPTSGLGWTLAALLIGLFNSFLSWLRPLLFRWRSGSPEPYRHVSGLPGFGTLLVLVGGLLGFGAAVTAAVGLAAILLDTGGSLWFLLATWKDSSFWDA
jgi:hypothetical protein